MASHHHPKWLEEARRAEGGGVSEDDKVQSQHLKGMADQVDDQEALKTQMMNQVHKRSSHYEDMINRANESGADPADVQDVLQGAMRRAGGGSVGAETVDEGDISPMAVEEKGRSIPMSQKSASQNSQMSGQAGQGLDQNKALNTPYKGD
jgi:hypothetical protein